MTMTAADILIDTLVDWNVEVIFGIPGDGINGIMESLRQRQDEIRFVQVRHEEAAAFMACAYAKFTGRLGICLATSSPSGRRNNFRSGLRVSPSQATSRGRATSSSSCLRHSPNARLVVTKTDVRS